MRKKHEQHCEDKRHEKEKHQRNGSGYSRPAVPRLNTLAVGEGLWAFVPVFHPPDVRARHLSYEFPAKLLERRYILFFRVGLQIEMSPYIMSRYTL